MDSLTTTGGTQLLLSSHHLLRQLHITSISTLVKLNSSTGKDCPRINLSVGVMVSPSSTAMNLGVILDEGLSCTPDITAVARSCRFALYNIHRIRSFLTKDAMQLLLQVLVMSCLDYCNSLLAGIPASVTKQMQHIQNAAVHLICSCTIHSTT